MRFLAGRVGDLVRRVSGRVGDLVALVPRGVCHLVRFFHRAVLGLLHTLGGFFAQGFVAGVVLRAQGADGHAQQEEEGREEL